jgi:hypothetical protein
MAFSYSIDGVFDVDQRWDALPGNGSMYCAPAAITNWMYYYAAHGRPGAIDYARTVPGNIPLNLASMGAYMDTDGEDGTYFSDAVDGLADWLEDHNIPANIYYRRASQGQDITYVRLRNRLQQGGNLVVWRGRYKKEDGEFERIGGHVMTLVSLTRTDNNTITVGVHDPDNNGSIHSQSASQVDYVVVTEKRRNIEGDSVIILRWGPGSVNSPYRCIDGVIAIVPLFAVTNLVSGILTLYSSSFESEKTIRKDFPMPFSGEIGDLVLNPSDSTASMIAKNTGEVWTINLADGTWNKISAISKAKLITYGVNDQLFVQQDNRLLAFDSSSKQVGQIDLVGVDALSYDHKHNRLVALSSANKALLSFSPQLTLLEKNPLPVIQGSGRFNLSLGSRDGTAVISREGSSQFARVPMFTKSSKKLESIKIKSTQAGAVHAAKGRLFLNEGGKIASYESDGKRKAKSIFDGLACGSFLKVSRSQYSVDDGKPESVAWRN